MTWDKIYIKHLLFTLRKTNYNYKKCGQKFLIRNTDLLNSGTTLF